MKTEMKPLQLPKVLKVEGSNCSNYINSHHLQFQFNMYEFETCANRLFIREKREMTSEKSDFGINHKNQP